MNKNILWQQLPPIIILMVLIFIVYMNVLHFGFANIDDGVYVINNSHVLGGLSVEGIKWAFHATFGGFWHPMTWISLMADAQIYAHWAGGYHLTNLILHLLNSFLLFKIFQKMTDEYWESLFIAALFALHPMHVESVAWISERKDVLSVFWGMLTLYAYVFYAENPRITRYLLVLIFFLFSLMSKPMLVTMPFIMLLLDYWPLKRLSFHLQWDDVRAADSIKNLSSKTASLWRVIWEKIPFFVLIIPVNIVTILAERKFGALPTIESFPLDIRIFNALVSYIRYMGKTILPINLSIYYPHPGMWPAAQVIIAGCFIVILSYLILCKMKRYPYLAVGWFWYLGTLVPVIGLIQIGPFSMADRYSYVPHIGLFIMVAWGLSDMMRRFPYKKSFISIFAILLIIMFSVLSWQRVKLWGDNFLLWDDVLKKYDVTSFANMKENNMAFAYNFRGLGYAEKGNFLKAIDDYSLALQIDGKYCDALNNRANAYIMIGQKDFALRDFGKVITINPKFSDVYYNRGSLYLSLNQLDVAIADITAAIQLKPDAADYYNNRGVALRLKGEYKKAFADFNQALRLNQNFAEAYFNRGIIHQLHQQYFPAVLNFTEALNIQPEYVDARFSRGMVFTSLGKYDQAMEDFINVLRIDSKHIPTLSKLGSLLKKMKKYDEASDKYHKILKIKPDDRDALENLQEIEKCKRNISCQSVR